MGNNKEKDELLEDMGCMPVATGLILLLVLFLCGCKAQKELQVERVEVPVPIVQEHTIESIKVDHVRDTLIRHDSVCYYVKGDTVRIEKWHYVQGTTNVIKVDTLIKVDSIEKPVEVVRERIVTKIEEVEKKLSWWQKTKMGLGATFLVVLAIGAVFGGLKLYGKIKKL